MKQCRQCLNPLVSANERTVGVCTECIRKSVVAPVAGRPQYAFQIEDKDDEPGIE